MARLKIKNIDTILTPGGWALALKPGTHGPNPNLLPQGLRNRGLLVFFSIRHSHIEYMQAMLKPGIENLKRKSPRE
jgi:hypothetical protein